MDRRDIPDLKAVLGAEIRFAIGLEHRQLTLPAAEPHAARTIGEHAEDGRLRTASLGAFGPFIFRPDAILQAMQSIAADPESSRAIVRHRREKPRPLGQLLRQIDFREAAIGHAPQPAFAAEPQGLVRCPVNEAGHPRHRPLEIDLPLRDPVEGGRSYPISRADPHHPLVVGRQHEPRSRRGWQLQPHEGTVREPVNGTRGTQPHGPFAIDQARVEHRVDRNALRVPGRGPADGFLERLGRGTAQDHAVLGNDPKGIRAVDDLGRILFQDRIGRRRGFLFHGRRQSAAASFTGGQDVAVGVPREPQDPEVVGDLSKSPLARGEKVQLRGGLRSPAPRQDPQDAIPIEADMRDVSTRPIPFRADTLPRGAVESPKAAAAGTGVRARPGDSLLVPGESGHRRGGHVEVRDLAILHEAEASENVSDPQAAVGGKQCGYVCRPEGVAEWRAEKLEAHAVEPEQSRFRAHPQVTVGRLRESRWPGRTVLERPAFVDELLAFGRCRLRNCPLRAGGSDQHDQQRQQEATQQDRRHVGLTLCRAN